MTVADSYFPFPINWETHPKASRVFRTTVNTSISGIEKRASLKSLYLRRQAFSISLLSTYEANYFKWFMWKFLHKPMAMPWYVDQVHLLQAVLSTDTTLKVEPVENTEFAIGSDIFLLSPNREEKEFVVSEIQSIANHTGYDILTLTAQVGLALPAYSFAFPSFVFTLQTVQEMTHKTSKIATYNIEAEEAWE